MSRKGVHLANKLNLSKIGTHPNITTTTKTATTTLNNTSICGS